MISLTKSCERIFRLYYTYNTSPDEDTLFNLLNSIHSINDIFIKNLNDNFFDSDEFISLKAIRNLYHHQEEVNNEFRIISPEDFDFLITDLQYMCFIRLSSVIKSVENLKEKYKVETATKMVNIFHMNERSKIVNINPCIFNFMVKVYEKLLKHNIVLTTSEYIEYKKSYDYETGNLLPHFVNGKFLCGWNDMQKLENILFTDIG